jgi:hypothetical protein
MTEHVKGSSMKSAVAVRPPEVQDWLDRQSSDHQQQAELLASAVHAADRSIAEAIKWRRLTFTIGGNWHHWLCAVAVKKQGASLMFHKGALLDDPAGLLQGDSRYLREIPFERVMEHPNAVTALVREAIAHQTDMLDEESRQPGMLATPPRID